MSKDLLYKAHITDRIELAINQIADAKSLIWTVDCMSDIVDSEGPKIIFSEKIKSPDHKPEYMSIHLKPIWDEITEKNLWNDDDKVMDIYTERIINEVEAWLDSLSEKRKEQPSVKVDISDEYTPKKKVMPIRGKGEFYSFLQNKDVQKTLMHIGDTRHLMGYLVQEKSIDGEVWFEYSCTKSMKGPYRISMTDYYERNHEKFDENPAGILADLKTYVEKKLDAMLFLDKELHIKKDVPEARELNRNLFALLIMTKGASRLTKLAERRNMKVKYEGQERSVTFYKSGWEPVTMAITISMDDFVNSMSDKFISASDDEKVSWFTEYCDQTIEKHIYDQKFEVNKHSLSYIHDSIRKWCKDHDVNVTFIDEKEDPLKTGYMLFWVYKEHLVTLVIDIANNPEFAGLCHEESDYADNGLQPWNPKYAKIRTSYALVIDDAHSIIEKVINMIIAELLAPKRKPPFDHDRADRIAKEILTDMSGLSANDAANQHTAKIIFGNDRPLAKNLQKAFKNYSSKELYKSCNSVPEAWINQFIEESAYFEDFMHASVNTIVELIKFIHMKEREAEGGRYHGK